MPVLAIGGEDSLPPALRPGFDEVFASSASIADIVRELEDQGYQGRYVLEQDTAIMGDEPAPGEGPIENMRVSVDYLRNRIGAPLVSR